MNHNDSPLGKLEKIGFKRVGEWSCQDDRLSCALSDLSSSRNILYAFVCGDAVMYIGKTVNPLKQRLYGYQNPGPTQSTNIKGSKLIRETLAVKCAVDVYALPDNGLLHYGGFHVNLAAGLEDSLLEALKPAWNKAGV